MGIILGSATTEHLDKSIRKSINEESIREVLEDFQKNPSDYENEIKSLEEVLNSDEIFAWGISSENGKDVYKNISRGDTLYLLENESNVFQYRAFVTTIIRNDRGLASWIWEDSDDMTVCFLENVQKIEIDKEEHLFAFGESTKSTLSESIYIKDVYQELSGCSPDEFLNIIYNEKIPSDKKITQEDYKEAFNNIKGLNTCRFGIGDIVLLGTENEKKSGYTSSKSIQRLQNFILHPLSCFKTSYSHVALCIDTGLFIEASGKKKEVVYSTLEELFKVISGSRYAQYSRYKKLTQNNASLISERSLYYVGTPYPDIYQEPMIYIYTSIVNKMREHSVNDEFYSFCSDLAMQILAHIKKKDEDKSILPIEKNSKVVLPWDIDKFLQEDKNKDWTCVTNEYERMKDEDNQCANPYKTLSEVNKRYYTAKQEALSVKREFYATKDYHLTIPLWYRMKIYHELKQGNSGEIKEYLARRSLYELLVRER